VSLVDSHASRSGSRSERVVQAIRDSSGCPTLIRLASHGDRHGDQVDVFAADHGDLADPEPAYAQEAYRARSAMHPRWLQQRCLSAIGRGRHLGTLHARRDSNPHLLIQTRPCRGSFLPEAGDVLMPVTVPATSRSSASPGPSRRSTPAWHSPSRYGCGHSNVRSLTRLVRVRGTADSATTSIECSSGAGGSCETGFIPTSVPARTTRRTDRWPQIPAAPTSCPMP